MSKKKILLIDFDQEFLKFLSGALADEGFEVVTATDGLSGFEKFSETHPDLIIMEAMLPKFHGFELCSRITSHPTKKAPVIIVTGIYKDSVYKTEALRSLGASAFFEKPLNLEELLNKVYELIGKPEVKKVSASPDEELDKLLKEALSFENPEKKPTEKARPVEKVVPKPQPVKKPDKSRDEEVDLILKSKLKDLIDENSVLEAKPVSSQPTEPERPSPTARQVETKKITSSTVPPRPVSEKPKKPESAASISRPLKPEIKKSEPSSEFRSEVKPERDLNRPLKAVAINAEPRKTSVKDTSPFKGYIEEEEEEKKVKNGATKYIGLAAAILAVAGVVAFLSMRKKETPTFTAQTSNQVAALQTSNSTLPETELAEEEIAQEIEKQMEAYRAQKSQDNQAKPSGNKSQPQSTQAVRRQESNPPAAPIIPKQTPSSLATIGDSQTLEPETPAGQILETVFAETKAEEEESAATVIEQTQATATAEPPMAIPVEEVKLGDLVPLSIVDVEPRPTKTVEPVYSEVDRRLGNKGQILLNVLISETGDVLEVVVIRGIKGSVTLEKEAVNAVKKWKFLPAEKNGVKVRVWKPISIGFGLSK
ncbi:MAG: TonB family protein [Acidobacteriota bacterium]|nr:TonB family protein [Acidobacteriota bacterium]